MNQVHEQPESDEQLDALLDEALSPAAAPGGVPDDLAQRVYARTVDRLPGRRSGVLARIGPGWPMRAAATVALAASVAIALMIAANFKDTTAIDAINRDLARLTSDIDQMDQDIDQEIEMLTMQVEQFGWTDSWDWGAWSIEQDILEYESQFGNGNGSSTF